MVFCDEWGGDCACAVADVNKSTRLSAEWNGDGGHIVKLAPSLGATGVEMTIAYPATTPTSYILSSESHHAYSPHTQTPTLTWQMTACLHFGPWLHSATLLFISA